MYKYLRCLNYQVSQMFYSLMIKFNTPTEAKAISDKNTKTLDLIVFTSKELFQEKQKIQNCKIHVEFYMQTTREGE